MTSDPFANYGETAAPTRAADPRAERQVKAPSALDLKLAERRRLSNTYRMLKRQERIATLEAEPRLKDFLRYLRKIGPEDGDELVEAVAESWLPKAPGDVRYFALHLIGRRSDKIRQQIGLSALDDPLPPETSVFFRAREVLVPGGRA